MSVIGTTAAKIMTDTVSRAISANAVALPSCSEAELQEVLDAFAIEQHPAEARAYRLLKAHDDAACVDNVDKYQRHNLLFRATVARVAINGPIPDPHGSLCANPAPDINARIYTASRSLAVRVTADNIHALPEKYQTLLRGMVHNASAVYTWKTLVAQWRKHKCSVSYVVSCAPWLRELDFGDPAINRRMRPRRRIPAHISADVLTALQAVKSLALQGQTLNALASGAHVSNMLGIQSLFTR